MKKYPKLLENLEYKLLAKKPINGPFLKQIAVKVATQVTKMEDTQSLKVLNWLEMVVGRRPMAPKILTIDYRFKERRFVLQLRVELTNQAKDDYFDFFSLYVFPAFKRANRKGTIRVRPLYKFTQKSILYINMPFEIFRFLEFEFPVDFKPSMQFRFAFNGTIFQRSWTRKFRKFIQTIIISRYWRLPVSARTMKKYMVHGKHKDKTNKAVKKSIINIWSRATT
jgi:hypothetical protein